MNELRRGLPPLPELFEHLPIDDRGYPVPWFVCKIDGKWDFRVADARKRRLAVAERLCWLCGIGIGKELAFVIGPMCAVNRNTSEPACHLACAEFAAQACPFMVRPAAQYRTTQMPEESRGHIGGLPGNPGAVCIWITKSFKPYQVPGGGKDDWLIRIGDPLRVLWYAEGKPATRQQILDSFERRLPALKEIATMEGPHAEAALSEQVEKTMELLPTA